MPGSGIALDDFVASIGASPLAALRQRAPWEITAGAEQIVRDLLAASLAEAPTGDSLRYGSDVLIHPSAIVEAGAVLKGPLVVGPRCFIAAGAYLRGGNWLDEGCTVGPGAELKSSFLFAGTRIAHFNFVGDSILGAGVNLEAGSIVCNHRNERDDKAIRVRIGSLLVRCGASKFGALIGDGCRIGANAVLAPGTLLRPASVVPRASLVDQEPG